MPTLLYHKLIKFAIESDFFDYGNEYLFTSLMIRGIIGAEIIHGGLPIYEISIQRSPRPHE